MIKFCIYCTALLVMMLPIFGMWIVSVQEILKATKEVATLPDYQARRLLKIILYHAVCFGVAFITFTFVYGFYAIIFLIVPPPTTLENIAQRLLSIFMVINIYLYLKRKTNLYLQHLAQCFDESKTIRKQLGAFVSQ